MNLQNLDKEDLLLLQQLINKALEQQKPLVKDLEHMIKEIMDEFDFDRVERAMEALNWRWRGEVPTLYDLRETAERLLRGAAESRLGRFKDAHHEIPIINATGGFKAKAWCDEDKTKIIGLELEFIVTSWDANID